MTRISYNTRVQEPVAQQPAVQLCAETGGLIMLGPTAGSLAGLDSLIGSPGAVAVEVESARLLSWDCAKAESVVQSRRISAMIRRGETPIVFLDTHRDGHGTVSPDDHDFVNQRLGQMIVGLADVPSYLAIYGENLAPPMLLEDIGCFDEATVAVMSCGLALMRVNQGVFRNLHVTLAPAEGPIARFSQLFDWFEARRVSPPLAPVG